MLHSIDKGSAHSGQACVFFVGILGEKLGCGKAESGYGEPFQSVTCDIKYCNTQQGFVPPEQCWQQPSGKAHDIPGKPVRNCIRSTLCRSLSASKACILYCFSIILAYEHSLSRVFCFQ